MEICTLLDGGLFADEARRRGLRVTSLNLSSVYSPRAALLLRRLILNRGYEIVHGHLTQAGTYAALATLGTSSPVLFFTEHNEWDRRRPLPVLDTLERLLYARFDRIIAVSEPVRAGLRLWLGQGLSHRVTVIENGVPVWPEFRLDREERARLMAELAVRVDSRPVLIAVGRLAPQKAPLDLIEACSWLRKFGHAFTCLVVGDGPLRGQVQKAVEEEGLVPYVRILGEREDVARLLSLADAFVMASHWEGLPLALLEAMAAGRPVVATSVGGIPGVVTDGYNGLLVPPRAPREMARAVARLLDDPSERRRLGSRARVTIEERYSVEAMASRLLTEYESAYARKHA